MSDSRTLVYLKIDLIPSAAELAEIASANEKTVVRYPTQYEILSGPNVSRDLTKNFTEALIQELSLLLSDYSIFESGSFYGVPVSRNPIHVPPAGTVIPGDSQLTILKVVSRDQVLAQADALVAAARRFRQVASDLMAKLAVSLNVPLTAFADPLFRMQIDPSGRNLNGKLTDDWDYGFHGYQCGFLNQMTGQKVDVELGYENEWGVLDPYFLSNFIGTTPEFQLLYQQISGYHDVSRALKIMKEEGRLKSVPSSTRLRSDGLAAG